MIFVFCLPAAVPASVLDAISRWNKWKEDHMVVGMSGITDDPNDPDVRRGPPDEKAVPQNKKYLVLSEAERAKGFSRPVREQYRHLICGAVTRMDRSIAETYARDPHFYGSTYCIRCVKHRPLSEFEWLDGEGMGT